MAKSISGPTHIANMALSHVGASDIESLEEDSSEANQSRIFYDICRRQTLEAFDWTFARRRQEVALHGDIISETADDPLAGVWGFRHQYPADALVIRKIQNPNAPPGDDFPFEIELSLDGETKSILSNIENPVIVYTRDIEDTGLFSALFSLALSYLLASLIAYPLGKKEKVVARVIRSYDVSVTNAAANDANERMPTPERDADTIRARI
ncbi:hypothetical protein LCGC14_0551980 [marine sediment metagenome]|uniref:Uncharacterized protein n=1 Tax=marine sediment metagenome TaxID=412755 RepID=A0A0F9UB13_9ZZZZ